MENRDLKLKTKRIQMLYKYKIDNLFIKVQKYIWILIKVKNRHE